jgi:hypothetical protein
MTVLHARRILAPALQPLPQGGEMTTPLQFWAHGAAVPGGPEDKGGRLFLVYRKGHASLRRNSSLSHSLPYHASVVMRPRRWVVVSGWRRTGRWSGPARGHLPRGICQSFWGEIRLQPLISASCSDDFVCVGPLLTPENEALSFLSGWPDGIAMHHVFVP